MKALVQAILMNAHAFEWSLQGMGMLRLHLPDNTRLHVWDSRCRVPNVSMIHDHLQWGLTSTVVAGRLKNRRYVDSDSGAEFKYTTLKPGYGCYFKHDPKPIRLCALQPDEYAPGESYSQSPAEIHETDAEDGTVTLMRKSPTEDESARVFWPADSEWVSAEPRRATPEEVAAITSDALRRWFSVEPLDAPAQGEREALRSALNAMLTQFGMDEDEWSKPTFNQARAALAARPAAAPEPVAGWQSIETAPMDGTEVLGYREDAGAFLMRYSSCDAFLGEREIEGMDEETLFQKDWFYGDSLNNGRLEGGELPTHWQPLPAAPSTKGGDHADQA